MLELTQAQLDHLDELEKQQYVEETCKIAIKEHPELAVGGIDMLIDRVYRAYRYAIKVGFTDGLIITQFLRYEAIAPNFYRHPAIDSWLKKSGYAPEQRFSDLLEGARNRMGGD